MNYSYGNKKIYVLDTSVILHDHNSFLNFEDNDIAIPITVLEELDNFKRGHGTRNFEAREFIRIIDRLSEDKDLQNWTSLNEKKKSKFKIIIHTNNIQLDANKAFGEKKADHQILNATLSLQEKEKDKKVILVTKDINLRIKAKALQLSAEDYNTGIVKDVSDLHINKSTIENVPKELIQKIYEKGFIEDLSFLKTEAEVNGYYILKSSDASALTFYNALENRMELISKLTAYGIKPRNAEQTFALHALLRPEIKLVTILGVAGTGKTLLALASAIEQRRDFKQIILARPIVPLSNKDIGYLPGDIHDKINPYIDPLWDNLKFIRNQYSEMDAKNKQILDMQKNEKIIITPLAYIRG